MEIEVVTDGQSSHILMILSVAAFSMYFYYANSWQRVGKKLIEGTVYPPYLRFRDFLLILDIGGFSVYVLKRQVTALVYALKPSMRVLAFPSIEILDLLCCRFRRRSR